jgi:hypothetical protein
MQCPFCQREMNSIDNGNPPPRLAMTWVCNKCPREVRATAERDIETQLIWTVKYLSIFVQHNDRQYCLHWDYINKHFDVRDTATSSSICIFRTQGMPDTITPDNALDKLKTYLLFS